MQLEHKSPEYYYETGWPVNIVNRLNISMGLYRRNYNYVKIGITSNPQKRFKQHQESNEWTGYSPMCNSDFYYVYILLGNHKRRKR